MASRELFQQSDSWLTYLTLDIPSEQATYDMGISNAGVVRLAPFGTAPMAIIDATRTQNLPTWLLTLPLNTPQWVEAGLVVALAGLLMFFLVRRRKAKHSANVVS
ncbi:MAG: hypothetical protein ABI234_06950 [Ktedonobacteraceae bacterium]